MNYTNLLSHLPILLLLSIPVVANPEPPEPPQTTIFVQADPEVRVTKRIIFVFDCSTSMGEDNRFAKSIAEVRGILEQPLDEAMFSMIGLQTDAFPMTGHNFFVWEGIPEPPKVPKGWAGLPSAEAVSIADKWLCSIKCTAWTDIFPAISKAFSLNKDREKLTIILFSDGNNTHPNWNGELPGSVSARIAKLQKARVRRGKDRIGIFVFGVGANQNVRMLTAIAKAGSGSYLTTENICKICSIDKKDRSEIQRYHKQNEHKD